MRPRIWSLSSLLVINALMASLVDSPVRACAGGEPDVTSEVVFDPAILGDDEAAPFFFTPYRAFYNGGEPAAPDFKEVNLDEWMGFFDKKLDREAWAEVLHRAPVARVDALIFALKGERAATAADAPFMAYGDRSRLIAALYYVGFAKRIEPFVIPAADRWEAKTRVGAAKSQATAGLVDGGKRSLAAAKLTFLRGRYAFQILRLHFYRGEHERAVRFFDEHRALFSDKSSVTWRALGYKAGAHYHLRQYADANYLYSVIFARYPAMRLSAFWSFHPQNEGDWSETLDLAKTRAEKVVLWQMLGIHADGPRAIEEIAKLDVKSKALPLLVVREVNRAEVEVNPVGDVFEGKREQTAELAQLIERLSTTGKVHKPFVWDLAAAHLYALVRNVKASERCLGRAEKRAPSVALVRDQLRAIRLYAFARGLRNPSPADEAVLARELGWLNGTDGTSDRPNPVLLEWSRKILSGVYREKGDVLRAVCLAGQDETFYQDEGRVDRMMAFLEKPNPSPFDRVVAGLCGHNRESLQVAQGLFALYRGDLERAKRLLGSHGSLNADPFVIHIRDCHDCDIQAAARGSNGNSEDLIARMAELLKEAADSPAEAAEKYFELGNAFYNISYYGNSRVLFQGTPLEGSPVVYDNRRAEAYYKKAMELFHDRELKAKAAFMAAKCELNASLGIDGNSQRDSQDYRWFRLLRDGFSDTRYYQEILRECGYFRAFVGAKKK